MKIAVTTSGTDLDAPIDPRFGRAAEFLIYDTDTEAFELVDNTQNLQAPQGAGIQAGQTIARSGAGAVLTGNCGPKAFQVLATAGIEVYVHVKGTVRQAIKAYQGGTLIAAQAPNVQGHWT